MLVVPNVGEARMLALILNQRSPADLELRLFTNNLTPASDTVLGDLVECTGGGYAGKALAGGDWVITPGAPSAARFAQQSFLFSGVPGVATIRGYYVVADGELLWLERLGTPFTVQHAGDELKVTPRFTGGSESGD